MRVLVVEDNEDHAELLTEELNRRIVGIDVVVARSRDSAIAALDGFFDFVICDLRIPTVDNGLDTAVEHGVDVERFITESRKGTPCMFFSAYGAEILLERHVIPFADQQDPFASGHPMPMLQTRDKRDLSECVDIVRVLSEEVEALEAVQISLSEGSTLSPPQERLVRLTARSAGARFLIVEDLGGLSSARTVKLAGTPVPGAPAVIRAVVKMDTLGNIDREESGFQSMARIVDPSVMATEMQAIKVGAAGYGAVAYSLATDHSSFFSLCAQNETKALAALEVLRQRLDSRLEGAQPVTTSVSDIRRLVLSDEEASDLWPPDIGVAREVVESARVQSRNCLLHGDLHGANVLVDSTGHPLLIDFGSVREGPASFDPLLLEMSFLFHPYGRRLLPRDVGLINIDWTDGDAYCASSPSPRVAASCRAWATDTGGSTEEILAVGYSWALRQLRYEYGDHDLALAILRQTAVRLTTS